MRIRNSGKEILLHKTVTQDGRKVRKKEEERRPAEAHTEILMGPMPYPQASWLRT